MAKETFSFEEAVAPAKVFSFEEALGEPAATNAPATEPEVVTSARPWQGAGAGRGGLNDPRRLDVERAPESFERPGFAEGFTKGLTESERPLGPGGVLLRAADALTGGFAQERFNKANQSVLDDKTDPALAGEFAKPAMPKPKTPVLQPRTDTISPTGGVVDALAGVPANTARSLGSTVLNFGALAAELGLTIQSPEQFRRAAADLDKTKARTGLGVSDEPLARTGTALDALIPSAKTLADYAPEGIKQLGMMTVMGPGAIIADAGARGVNQAREEGLGIVPSVLYGAGQAASEGVPEAFSAKFAIEAAKRIPLAQALRGDAKAVTTAFQQTAQTMGVELGSEQVSALGNWVVDKIAADPTATPDRLVADMKEAVKATIVQGPTMLAGAKLMQSAATGLAPRPEDQAARELARELNRGNLPPGTVETLNPNLSQPAITPKTLAGLTEIGAAASVDEAIIAAARATTPQAQAVDNIGRLLGDSANVSQPGNIPPVDSGAAGAGAPEPGIRVEAGVGASGAAGPALDAGGVRDQPAGGAAPLATGRGAELTPDIAETTRQIQELERAPESKPGQETRGEPASVWFGRRGDGYQTPEDAQSALPTRTRISPELDWRVEQMPTGRYRLAGYDTETRAPTFTVRMNPTGTATVLGNPKAIAAKLAEAGITKVAPNRDGVTVATSQAQAAAQFLGGGEAAASTDAASAAIKPVAPPANPPTQAQAGLPAEGAGESRPAPAAAPEQVGPYGRDLTPIAQGGKPFKTKAQADAFRKANTNNMRTVKQGAGFVLRDLTAKELAAREKAAKRLAQASTSPAGVPIPAHAFIAGKGGLAQSAMADAGFDRNMKVGNRWLFAGTGKPGLTLAEAAELLAEAGYIREESEAAAAEIIKRSIRTPQYTAEGWERIAEAEQATRFEDHLAAQQEAATDEDPFGPAPAFTPAEVMVVPKSAREEYAALIDAIEAAGLDADAILEEAARITENLTQEQYSEYVRQALEDAIANSRREADRGESAVQGREDAERSGTESSSSNTGRPGDAPSEADEGLTTPTEADVLAQQDRREQADDLDQREQIQREASGFQLQAQAPEQRKDTTGDLLGGLSADDMQRGTQKLRDLREKLRSLEDRIVGAAGMAPGFLEDALRSRKVSPDLKAQRETLRADIRELAAQLGEKPVKLNLKADDGTAPLFSRGRIDDATRAENLKRWSNNAPYVSSEAADTYDFKTGQKVMVEAYHGTARPDRVGTVFQRKRATSGPMAFFTSAPELASSYAQGKADTSITDDERNYPQWFKYKPAGQRSAVDIVRAWNFLDNETKDRIAALAPRIKTDDATGEQIELGPEGTTNGVGNYEWELQQTQRPYDRRGNPLKALVEGWLNGGMLFNDEERFLRVLELAGFPVKDVTYDAPNASYPFVYKTYIAMQKPLVTGDVPQAVIDALKDAAKRDRSRAQVGGADMWDKNTRTLREWVANYTDPENDSASYVWTSIPDKVTDVLKSMGYDGIIDWSGKGGGDRHPVYIPFEETQVKSATGNKGTFDPMKKDIRFSRAQPFYSALSKSIEGMTPKALPGAIWKDGIKGLINKGAVKEDEVEWSGIREWLDLQTGKVSKDAVLAYLDANGVQVQEVVLGGTEPKTITSDEALERLRNNMAVGWRRGDQVVQMYSPESIVDDGSYYRELVDNGDAEWIDTGTNVGGEVTNTKYGNYTLPGGQNYREVLLTLPAKDVPQPLVARPVGNGAAWEIYNTATQEEEGTFASEAEARAAAARTNAALKGTNDAKAGYRSSHWDQPNVLAHIRLNDRTDADGARVLFVEELQSDWGQAGKKSGFQTADLKIDGKTAEEWQREGERLFDALPNEPTPEQNRAWQQATEHARTLRDRARAQGLKDGRQVPNAPFVTSTDKWLTLALKRIITMAAQEGYDRVAFVNGEQSAERYDLSKQVRSIAWTGRGNDTEKSVTITPNSGNDIEFRVMPDGTTTSSSGGFAGNEFAGKRLDEIVGKDVAERIMGAPYGDMRGDGLKVGGEGMKAFYDKIVPNTLKEVLKKVGGGALESVDIGLKERRIEGEQETPTGRPVGIVEHPRNGMLTIELDDGSYWGLFASTQGAAESRAQAEREFARISKAYSEKSTAQPGFTITPAMREKASAGLPLFRKGTDQTPGLTPTQFTQALSEAFGAKVADRLQAKGVVVPLADQTKLPAHVVPFLRAGDVVFGFYDPRTDRTYAVLENLTPDMVKGLAMHEVGVHYGFEAMLGADKYKQVMKRLDLMRKSGNVAVQAAYDQAQANAARPSQIPEETLAYLVQEAPNNSVIKDVIARIKAWLFREFGIGGKYLTEADLHMLAKAAVQHAARTEPGGVEVPAFMRQNEGMANRRSSKEVGRLFTDMVKRAEDDLREVLFNWNESELNADKDRIVGFPGRDRAFSRGREGGKINISKAEFLDWLASDSPFDANTYGSSASDPAWIEQIGRLREIAGIAPTPDTSLKQGRPDAGMQERPTVRAVSGSLGEPAQSGGGAGSDANDTPFRVVDLFGNGSRVQHFDDRRGLFYEAQRYPSGRVGWRAGEIVDGNESWLSDKEYPTMDAAIASVRGQRAANTRKANFDAKYGDIPNTWKGEAKKVAMALIDAGHEIDRFSNSTQSTSKYIYLDNGAKVRLADHNLPGSYDQPDFDFRYGDDIAEFVASIPNESPAPTPDGAPESNRTPQTETKAFKDWFGDSKVVDAEGKPLVVFHSSTFGDFSTFDKAKQNKGMAGYGFYFSDADGANIYADYGANFQADKDWQGNEKKLNIMPVYLAIQNPLVADNIAEVRARFGKADPGNFGQGRKYGGMSETAQTAIQRAGYDGVIANEYVTRQKDGSYKVVEPGAKGAIKHPVYVAFEPNQIKSALGNRGTFDPKDPDIRFSRANTAQTDEADPTPPELSPWRDATGRLQFAPGAWLAAKYGDTGKGAIAGAVTGAMTAGPVGAVVGAAVGAGIGAKLSQLQLKAPTPELRRIMRQMKLDVAKAQETAAAVAGEATKLTDDERAMVSDLIEKELKAGTVPPEHAVRLAAMINSSMEQQTNELVRLGMLTKDSADRWRGQYLPRYYESKLTEKAGDLWADAMRSITRRPSAMKGIKGKHLRGRGLYETIPESQLEDYKTMGWEVRDPDYQPGVTTDGTVQVWRDFTRQERDKMGEIRDAGFRFVMGYMQTQKDIALGKMFEQLAIDPEMSSRLETEKFSVRVPDGTAPGTEVKTYGKLAGRYVSPETLSQLSLIEESQSEALMMYRKALGIWKEGKTVLNPVSHVNNTISNMSMAHFAGVSYGRADKYLAAMRDFAKKSPMILEAKDNGLFLGTLSEAELMNTLPEDLKALAQKQEGTAEKVGRTTFNLMTFYLRRPMGWAYQAEDTFFRYLIYKDARGRGMEPQDAVDYAQRYIFTYDDLPKTARRIRDFGIPFFAYTYKAVPALLHTALTHPERLAAPAAVLWTINAAAYAIAAGDDEDDWDVKLRRYLTDPEYREKARAKEKLERELLPEWNKGTTSLMTPKVIRLGNDELTKLPLFIDVSRIIPGGDLFDVNPNAGGIGLPQPFTPSHPLFTTAVAMLANKDLFFGKDLTDSNDTAGEKFDKRAAWMWKQLTPAIAVNNYHFERGMNALAQASGGEVTWLPEFVSKNYTGVGRDGLPVQPKLAALQTFGIKIRPYDLDKAEQIQEGMRNKLIREIDAEMRSLRRLNNLGAVSDQSYEKAKELSSTKKDRVREGKSVDGEDLR